MNLDADVRAIDALADPRSWAAGAAHLVADLGFVLINATHPEAPAGSHLLVALRAAPTLRHFDPEAITFYAPTREGKVAIATVDRSHLAEAGLASRSVLWGHIHVIDRLGVENRFLSLGGQLRMTAVDPALTVLDLRSPGPIVAWGGHSQGSDALAAEIGAFFGRLITVVNFRKGAEAALATTPPAVLYAAFLAESGPRLRDVVRRHGLERAVAEWIGRETDRVRRTDAAAWREGQALLERASLGERMRTGR